jgi:fructokinase
MRLGAIEAGGTKFLCGVGDERGRLLDVTRVATRGPEETLRDVQRYFAAQAPVEALGISCFGPLDVARGLITGTPKQLWRNFPIVARLRQLTGIACVALDTDVHGAVLAECRLGAGRGFSTVVYVTVGTGIGGGAVVSGRLVRSREHPEMGHMRIPHDWVRDPFAGTCEAHGDCLEGLASGAAIARRGHLDAGLITDYLAYAACNLTCLFAPDLLIFGGGVMQSIDHGVLQRRTAQLLNGYMEAPPVVPPQLEHPGLVGALLLAAQALSARGELTAKG